MKLGMQMVEQLEKAEQVDGDAKEVLNALLSHSDGARGWWVTSLTVAEMEPLFASDQGVDAMVDAVLANPDPNRRLLAMNVAMSTATAEYWKAEGNAANAEGSLTTKRRTTVLLRELLSSLSGLDTALAELRAAASGEQKEGEWVAFLDRWGYGPAQRTAIVAALDSVQA